MRKSYREAHIWIVGASSGIGEALAIELSNLGAKLVLSARNLDRLNDLNTKLGGRHHVLPLDVTDEVNFSNASQKVASLFPRLDCAIYMAAFYKPTAFSDIDHQSLNLTLSTNLKGAFTFSRLVVDLYRNQGGGQLVLCGSVAGYRGLPNAQPYGATKAAIANLAESLRLDLAHEDIDVKLLSPGFVRTPMTDKNSFKMPMIIEPEQAAKAIAKGLQSDAFEIHFPKKFTYFLKFLRLLPYWLYFHWVKGIKS